MHTKNKKQKVLLSILTLLFAGALFVPNKLSGSKAATEPYLNGWDYDFNNGASGTISDERTFVKVEVNNAGTADWHAKLGLYEHVLEPNTRYQWTVATKSVTRMVKANFIVDQKVDGSGNIRLADRFNAELQPTLNNYEFLFETTSGLSGGQTKVEFLFQFGGNWEENKSAPFTLEIERITIEKLSRQTTALYASDFSNDNDGYFLEVDSGRGVVANLSQSSNNLVLDVTNFGSVGDPWDIHLKRGDLAFAMDAGKQYELNINLNATNAKHFELGIEDDGYTWERRATFKAGTFASGVSSMHHFFTAERSFNAPTLHLQLGKDGVNPTTLSFSEITIYSFDKTVVHELRVGRYVREFAVALEGIDSCIPGTSNDGYMAVPALHEQYATRLFDPELMATTYISDYDYTYGEGSGPKVADVTTVSDKWNMLVNMYNANRGENPEISLLQPQANSGSIDTNAMFLIALIGVIALTGYRLILKRK